MTEIPFPTEFNGKLLSPNNRGLTELNRILSHGGQVCTTKSTDNPICEGSGPSHLLRLQTSGTSGDSKAILRQASTWSKSFEVMRDVHNISSSDRYAALGSLGNSISLYALIEGRTVGADLALLDGISPRRQARLLLDLEITVLYLTPTQLRLLCVALGSSQGNILAGVRLIMVGGGPMPFGLLEQAAVFFPQAVVRYFYGTSETSFISWSDEDTPAGSVGSAFPGVDIQLDENGEIWVSSPYVFLGYEGNATTDLRRKGGSIATGEVGAFDVYGNLFIKGRLDRMITVSDRNVYPEEIETLVASDPTVELCAVVSLPDLRRGNMIICVIQGKESARSIHNIRTACHRRFGSEGVPQRFVFLSRLPLLPGGKPDLRTIRADLAAAQ